MHHERSEEALSAAVSDVQRCCFDDGDGLRTTVFFKGCPLHCPWCHNPETIPVRPVLLYAAARCVGCGVCAAHCPSGLPLPLRGETDCAASEGCTGCLCPQDALRVSGRRMTLGEILRTVREDAPFYAASGGGVTLSGGEPLLWPEMCTAVAEACRREGIPVLLDTAGCVKEEVFSRVAALTDEVYLDLKLPPERYGEVCGAPLGLEHNLEFLLHSGIRFALRVPLIPGYAACEETAEAMAAYAARKDVRRVHLLPFHPLARSKYEQIGREYPFPNRFLTAEEQQRLLDIWRRFCPETELKG